MQKFDLKFENEIVNW